MSTFNNNFDIEMDFNTEYQESISSEPWEYNYQAAAISQEYPREISQEYQNEILQEYQKEVISENQTNISDTEVTSVTSSINTKRQRSWVWEHFTLDNNSSKPKCNYCSSRVPSSKGNTSNMASHLRNKHHARIQNSSGKQLTLQETFQNTVIEVS